ncbi:nitrogen fixation protein NifR, partial [Staphylococcus aureus]
GGGPNKEEEEKSAYKNVQVWDGPQHREFGFAISTGNASWGGTTIKKYFFYRN